MAALFYASLGAPGDSILLNEGDSRHISQVLRLHAGEAIEVCDGMGQLARCTLLGTGSIVTAKILEVAPTKVEFPVALHFYPSLSKGERFDWMLSKLCELGARSVTPVISKHCIVRTLTEEKLTRYRRILAEASKQCKRGILPILNDPISFEVALSFPKLGSKLFCWEESTRPLGAVLGATVRPSDAHVLTGPEGGYSPEEANAAKNSGWIDVSLGKLILRCETAPMAAAAAIGSYWYEQEAENGKDHQ
jgi:16S rRNA (uracil1498-N3)-methyltransferase